MQPAFDFNPPVQGSTQGSKQASWTGAREAVECYPARVSAYLQVVENAGAISDHEAATVLGCQLCSINSIRGYLRKHGPELVPDGHDVHRYYEAGKERVTKRTRWKLHP